MVDVGSGKGMLVSTGGRRGPTYALVWTDNGVLFSLTGYGVASEAVPLAKSLH